MSRSLTPRSSQVLHTVLQWWFRVVQACRLTSRHVAVNTLAPPPRPFSLRINSVGNGFGRKSLNLCHLLFAVQAPNLPTLQKRKAKEEEERKKKQRPAVVVAAAKIKTRSVGTLMIWQIVSQRRSHHSTSCVVLSSRHSDTRRRI